MLEGKIIQIAEKAIVNAVEHELVGYDRPLSNFVNTVLESHKEEFIKLIDDEVMKILNAQNFRNALSEALNLKLAKILINRLGGELEQQVNQLKANPETRAKITLAISNVINDINVS